MRFILVNFTWIFGTDFITEDLLDIHEKYPTKAYKTKAEMTVF